MTQLKLTQTVQKGGCAAKLAASDLRRILDQVRFPEKSPQLLVDGGLFDDAAIYKLSADSAMVQTLDFFTPIVDTPKIFGEIAAANALSDVYAMGGVPATCMAILAFPAATLSEDVAVDVLQGACDKIREAKASLVGGHSIDDDTLKFGLSVTGFVHPDRVWSNSQSNVGDTLILTKGLGTGGMTAALKRQEVSEEQISEALDSMRQLNNILDLLSEDQALGIHAATDITGFGLSGHSMQMAEASKVTFEFRHTNIPLLKGAIDFLERGFLTKAHKANALYTQNKISSDRLSEIQKLILHDPQTSGGLLLSVDSSIADSVLAQIRRRFPKAASVGRVVAQTAQRCIFDA